MSLLMDALRRAEAEKKDAAGRAADPGYQSEALADELRLEPLETSTERTMRSVLLAEDDTLFDRAQAPPRQYARADEGRDSLAHEPVLRVGNDDAPPLGVTPARGSAAQPALVTAQTVFEATRGGSLPRALFAIIACTVLLALVLAGVGLFVYRQTPVARPLPSPRVAAQVETPIARPPPVTATPVIEAVAPPMPPAPVAPAALPPEAPVVVIAPEPPSAPIPPPATPAAPSAAASAPPLSRTLSAELPKDAEIRGGELHIAKRAHEQPLTDDVTRAYGAFQLGQLDSARELYRQALKRDPERTDAMLGLAAIAMRENRLPEAHQLYRQVLRREPRHPIANAALFMIEGGAGDEITEARLKLLADHDVDSPYLRFALGNLYARQKRWPDAQEAYFAAFSRAPDNADYAYNLAVSLDQLGQPKAALEYYRKALTLQQGGTAAFDPARANARVAAIAGAP